MKISFNGEFFYEVIEINGEKAEHIGFRSFDGKFEEMMNTLPEKMELPKEATLTVEY